MMCIFKSVQVYCNSIVQFIWSFLIAFKSVGTDLGRTDWSMQLYAFRFIPAINTWMLHVLSILSRLKYSKELNYFTLIYSFVSLFIYFNFFFIVEIGDNRSFIEFAWVETGDSSFWNCFANDAIRGCEALWVWQILIDKEVKVIEGVYNHRRK